MFMSILLPFQINSGDIKYHPFQPQDHKKSLRKGTVPNALPIAAGLKKNNFLNNNNNF